jgi:phosphoribosylaminoimidazole-succinocarboxamide synthase
MSPVECVVRNFAAGSMCRRLGVEEGIKLEPSTFEFFLKNDELHDPMINDSLIETFGWATADEVEVMKKETFKVNDILSALFAEAGLILVDFKLEFGRLNGKMILGDEFSPDGCRIWDAETLKKLDKDRYRQQLGGVTDGYIEVAKRLGISLELA